MTATIIDIASVLLLILGLWIAGWNWYTIVVSRRQQRYVSPVPFLGALFMGIGAYRFAALRPFAWVGVVLDYGTLTIVLSLPSMAKEMWRTSRFNLVHEFGGNTESRSTRIRLFKHGNFVINCAHDPPAPCANSTAKVVSYGFVGQWVADGNAYQLTLWNSPRVLTLLRTGGGFVVRETGYPSDCDSSYDKLDAQQLVKTA